MFTLLLDYPNNEEIVAGNAVEMLSGYNVAHVYVGSTSSVGTPATISWAEKKEVVIVVPSEPPTSGIITKIGFTLMAILLVLNL